MESVPRARERFVEEEEVLISRSTDPGSGRKRESRVKEFRTWVLERSTSNSSPTIVRCDDDEEEEVKERHKKLHERLSSAEGNREKTLEGIRRRASLQSKRSEHARRIRQERITAMQRQFEESMKNAVQNRDQILDERMEKLAKRSAHVDEVLLRQKQGTQELLERSTKSMESAEKLRKESLELAMEYAKRDLNRVQEAKRITEEQQKRDREDTLFQLTQRLEQASARRYEQLSTISQSASSPLNRSRDKTTVLRNSCSKKLQRTWRNFCKKHRTTASLSQEFADLGISAEIASELDFDSLSCALQKQRTLYHTSSLLKRLQSKYMLSQGSSQESRDDPIHELLQRLFPGGNCESKGDQTSRYPVRVFLCAYMILGHPSIVLGGIMSGEESMLQHAATEMVAAFESLHEYLQRPPVFQNMADSLLSPPASPDKTRMLGKGGACPTRNCSPNSFARLLCDFDRKWIAYLGHFIRWKSSDAETLESDLIEMACKMVTSMVLKGAQDEEHLALSPDLEAVLEQVNKDVSLIRERMHKLRGEEGCNRFDNAISQAKQLASKKYEITKKSRLEDLHVQGEANEMPVQPTIKQSELSSPLPATGSGDLAWDGSFHNRLTNEQIILELVYNSKWRLESHGENPASMNRMELPFKSLRDQVQSTMETLFWEGITEELRQIPFSTNAIERLAVEIYDDIASIIPRQLVADIRDVLNPKAIRAAFVVVDSGVEYLHKLLKNTLALIRQLGAPAREEESLKRHEVLLKTLEGVQVSKQQSKAADIAFFAPSIVEAFRFVLQETKQLKLECANARLQMMARGLLRGKSAYSYMRAKFYEKHSLTDESLTPGTVHLVLPRMLKWYTRAAIPQAASTRERLESLAKEIADKGRAVDKKIPSVVRSGLSMMNVDTAGSQSDAASTFPLKSLEPACDEERRLVFNTRIGILAMVVQQDGLRQEDLPETMVHDHRRLFHLQDQFQRLMFLAATSIVVQQRIRGKVQNMEEHISKSAKRVEILLNSGNVAMLDIAAELVSCINTMSNVQSVTDTKSLEDAIARTLISMTKKDGNARLALQLGLSQAVEAFLLLGDSPQGCQAAVKCLLRCGAVHLQEDCKQLAMSIATIAEVQLLTFCVIFGSVDLSSQDESTKFAEKTC